MSEPRLSLAPSRTLVPQATPVTPTASRVQGAAVLDSAALLQGQQEVTIAHQGHHYRLRVTSLGKLILTK